MKKSLFVLMMSLVALLGVFSTNSIYAADGEKVKVAYSIPSMFTTFWAACIHGFKEQCDEYGWDAVTLDPNGDTELQVSQLLNQVTQGAKAICISPIEKDSIGPTITKINKAGVPVFCIDRRGDGDVTSTLETDNKFAGEAMAKQIISDYGENIKVLIVLGVLSDTPTIDRNAGAMKVFDQYPSVNVVGNPSAGEYSNEAAMSTVKNYLQSNPDLDVVFVVTDALVPGALAAIQEAGHKGLVGDKSHIGLYSVDGAGEVLDMIETGTVDGTFSQYPIKFGRDVVKAMKDCFEGKKLKETVYYYGDVVTNKNIEELKKKGDLWGEIIR